MSKIQTIGILGGLGPDTTAHFYLDFVRAATTDRRPAVCIFSLPLDLKKEAAFIESGAQSEYIVDQLLDGARLLERARCDRIVIPCNTVHEFHSLITNTVAVPVDNIINITADAVARHGWKNPLLLATSRTVKTQLYDVALARRGISLRLPSADDQRRLDQIIIGILGDRTDTSQQEFLRLLAARAGTDNIILGCTDLQLLFSLEENVIDSMSELVKHTARLMV